MVDKAAMEIRIIGREYGQVHSAQKMSDDLLKMKENDEQLILEYCIRLYTKASFLCRACHRDLNNYYSVDDEKLIYYIALLDRYINLYGKSYTGTVYRGTMMNNEKLKLYLTNDIHTEWFSSTYLSTSKSRQIGELYGNVLLIINIQKSDDQINKAVDISEISAIPDEEEILLTPKYKLHKEKESEFDDVLKKHIIYLTSIYPSVSSVIPVDKYDNRKFKQRRDHEISLSMMKDDHHEEIHPIDSNSDTDSNRWTPILFRRTND